MDSSILDGVINFIVGAVAQYPKLAGILAIAYIVGLAVKVLRDAVEKFVLESPSKSDDLKLEEIKKNSIVKIVLYVADLLIRLKKPESK